MKSSHQIYLVFIILLLVHVQKGEGQHLFILSGQSNMARMDETQTFIPFLENSLGTENIVVVKDAHGGQPIRQWLPPHALYDSLLQKINSKNLVVEKLKSVSFIWMQGERDAREELGTIYEQQLWSVYQRLSNDLQFDQIHFIIGRINDFDLNNDRYPHWTLIRDIQVKVGGAKPYFDWVDTDDLNDGLNHLGHDIENDLHLTPEGYRILGERFARAALKLIGSKN